MGTCHVPDVSQAHVDAIFETLIAYRRMLFGSRDHRICRSLFVTNSPRSHAHQEHQAAGYS